MKLHFLKGKYVILALTVPLVVVADQVTKALAVAYLKPLILEMSPSDRYVTVMDGFFRLQYAENTGAVWGLFRDTSPTFRVPFFIVMSILAIGFIIWFFHKIDLRQKLLPLAVSMVLGGAVGNLIDRIGMGRIGMGKVVDFIDWYVTFDNPKDFLLFAVSAGEKHWPTFNVADVAITIGVVLLLIQMFIAPPQKSKEEDTGSAV